MEAIKGKMKPYPDKMMNINNNNNKKKAIIEAFLYDLKAIKRNLSSLSSAIDTIDNGSNEIINEYFDAKEHLNRLIELIEKEEGN
jgi:t-SNARE complex subunit (syntaxin)